MSVIISLGIVVLNVVYRFFWLFPVQEKVVFISRQSDEPSVDIRMLAREIKKQDQDCRIVILCKMMNPGFCNRVLYCVHMMRQMYHLATSRVIILDGYCMLVSVLKHRRSLSIVQIWHALGCMKKFGYSILDQKEGRSTKIANLMHMHRNYDYIFVSSDACKSYLSEAYNCDEAIMKSYPLPRVDLLRSRVFCEESVRKIMAQYPQLQGRKTILYAPTFRMNHNEKEHFCELPEQIDFKKYNFVLKKHPLMERLSLGLDVIVDEQFDLAEWLVFSDYVITDYSATVFEAAAADKPLFFYVYDLDEYADSRSFYIDFPDELPGFWSKDFSEVMHAIEEDKYDMETIRAFAAKYIDEKKNCTKRIVNFILNLIEKE